MYKYASGFLLFGDIVRIQTLVSIERQVFVTKRFPSTVLPDPRNYSVVVGANALLRTNTVRVRTTSDSFLSDSSDGEPVVVKKDKKNIRNPMIQKVRS